MSAASETRRLRRSLAAVESRYVRDLARRDRGVSRASRGLAGGSGGGMAGRAPRREAPESNWYESALPARRAP
jgi:hypothetical protein